MHIMWKGVLMNIGCKSQPLCTFQDIKCIITPSVRALCMREPLLLIRYLKSKNRRRAIEKCNQPSLNRKKI